MNNREESLKWLSSPEGGKVIVHPIEEHFQQVANEPCSLISIVGRAREGKSFLMNCLSRKENLFGVSNGHDPCTQGVDISKVWMPLSDLSALSGGIHTPHDLNIKVGFLDVEGQGDKDVSYDANLICPVLLVSKCVIFNWKGDLQKDLLLSSLGVMARAAQNITIDKDTNKSLFGHLHIVFRDWQADDNVQNSSLSVQDALFQLERSGPGHDARNRIRTLILSSFNSVRVWLFDPPSEYTKDLKQKLVFERTSDVFRSQVRTLREALSHQLKEPTYLADNVLTGRAFMPLTEQIAEALNNGRAVLPSSAYLNVIRHDMQSALNVYRSDLAELIYSVLDTTQASYSNSRWVDVVNEYITTMHNEYFATLSATITTAHTVCMTELIGKQTHSTSIDSPVVSMTKEYTIQAQEIHTSAQTQFNTLYHTQFIQWLQSTHTNKHTTLTSILTDSIDVTDAMLCQVNALQIAPLHTGDDGVDCYADAVCAEIYTTLLSTVEEWLLYRMPQFVHCIEVSDSGVYKVINPTSVSPNPIIASILHELHEEVTFLNQLHTAIYTQAVAFKTQWRYELGEGRAYSHSEYTQHTHHTYHTVHSPDRHTTHNMQDIEFSPLSESLDARFVTDDTAGVTEAESIDPLDVPVHVTNKTKRRTFLGRLAVSIEEQRVRARVWAQSNLGLRFDANASTNSAFTVPSATNSTTNNNTRSNTITYSNNKSDVPRVVKSFAQQKKDALNYARRLFGTVVVEADRDDRGVRETMPVPEEYADEECMDDSFMHIDADDSGGESESEEYMQPISMLPVHVPTPSLRHTVVPGVVPVIVPVSVPGSVRHPVPTVPRSDPRGARTPAQSGVLPRPSTPVLGGSDSEAEEEELATDTISEITGAFAQPTQHIPTIPRVPSVPRVTSSTAPVPPTGYPAPGTMPTSRAQTPSIEPGLLHFYKRCLADIYTHTVRCDVSLVQEVLSREFNNTSSNTSSGGSLRKFEIHLCRKIRTTNRNLAVVLNENECTFLCDVDFNTDRTRTTETDPASRLSPSPDRRDSTSRASMSRVDSMLTGDTTYTNNTHANTNTTNNTNPTNNTNNTNTNTTTNATERNSIYKAGAYQIHFKDPVVSKASCIFYELFGRDRFLKAKIAPLSKRTIDSGIRRRTKQLVENGFQFGGRMYSFLGGEGKDRSEGQAYFFATHDTCSLLTPISVNEVRQALADFDQVGRMGEAIKPSKPMAASKINARLMLGFSPTYPALQLLDSQVHVIDDISTQSGEGIMTDGCGFISSSLLSELPFAIANGIKFCARRLPVIYNTQYTEEDSSTEYTYDPVGEMYAIAALPNTIQIRLSCRKGLFKGCLTVTSDTTLCPHNCVVMRQSMLKVPGAVHIHKHTPCTLFVNKTFEKSSALAPGSFRNATVGVGSTGVGNPWTGNFSVDLALLVCHLGLPIEHVLRLALREVDEIGDISNNRSTAMETVHRILRRYDRKDPDDDYCSDDEKIDISELPHISSNTSHVSGVSSSGLSGVSSSDPADVESSDISTNYQSALYSMMITSETAAMKAMHFLVAGHSLQEPQLQKYLSRLQLVALNKLRRLKFRLPNSAYLVGVPDPYGVLKENEVFAYLPLGDSELRTSAVIPNCEVLVTRYPLHHPGDIRKLHAVQNEALSVLVGNSSNAVLFFSTQGNRSQADKMGGGDFDGDEYCLIFNQTIVNAVTTVPPYNVTDFPASKAAEPAKVQDASLRDGMGVELLHGLVHHANSSKVGLYSTMWLAFADRNPASAGAKVYDHLARLALDAAKTGLECTAIEPPVLTEKPHYLGAKLSNIKVVYHSETVVGVVTDVIGQKVTALQPLSAPPVADPDIYRVLENGEVIFDVMVEINYRQQRQLDGHEEKWDLWERWKANFDHYRIGVGKLSTALDTTTNTTTTGTNTTYTTTNNTNSNEDNIAQMQTLKCQFIEAFDTDARNLHHDPRYINFTGYTARRVLASIVYHLTYENCKSFANFYRVGFCWEVCPAELHDNKKRSNMKRAKQHEFDLLPAMYWKDMYNI